MKSLYQPLTASSNVPAGGFIMAVPTKAATSFHQEEIVIPAVPLAHPRLLALSVGET